MATIAETFTIKGEDSVRLRIEIGEGQIGGYHVILDSREMQSISQDATHADYDLGPGQDLRYLDLISTVLVTDVNPHTDKTSLTVRITQGGKRVVYTQTETAITGGTVAYGIAIFFE